MLRRSFQDLIKEFKTGVLLLTLTSPASLTNFDANERITAPWTSLDAAVATGHHTFLDANLQMVTFGAVGEVNGTNDSPPLELATFQGVMLEELERGVSKTLEPLLVQFCQNELLAAATAIEQVASVVESLRTSEKLFERANRALAAVRDAQAKHLDSLLNDPVVLLAGKQPPPAKRQRRGEEDLEEEGALGSKAMGLKAWLQAQSRLLGELEQTQRLQSPLSAKYRSTFKELLGQIDEVVQTQFELVLTDSGWEGLDKASVDQIDLEFSSFMNWLSKQPPTIADALAVADDDGLQQAQQRIQFRKSSFVVTNFEAKEPEEMAQIIEAHRKCPREYAGFIEKYYAAYGKTHEAAYAVLLKPLVERSPRELVDVVVRLRSLMQHFMFEGAAMLDVRPYRKIEEEIMKQGKACFDQLLTQLGLDQDERSQHGQQLDETFKVLLASSVDLVLMAADGGARELPPTMPAACREIMDEMKTTAARTLETGKAIYDQLMAQVNGLINKAGRPPTCPADLNGIGEALRRLQVWEGIPGASSSILQLAERLESALLQTLPEGTSSSNSPPPLRSPSSPSSPGSSPLSAKEVLKVAGSHQSRVGNVCTVLCNLLDKTISLLQAEWDPENGRPLESAPFELALCNEMDRLVDQLSWRVSDIRSKCSTIKTSVHSHASEFRTKFNAMLADKKFEEAGKALKSLKRFEMLMEMEQFASCKGRASDYKAEIDEHAQKIFTQVQSMLRTMPRCDEIAPYLINLKILEDKIPSATTAARKNINGLLSLAQKKWPQGMQLLAATLRSIDPVLGQAIITSSEIFASVRVGMVNKRTEQDPNDVLAKLQGDPSICKDALKEQARACLLLPAILNTHTPDAPGVRTVRHV